ncbi:hypothetical protein HNR46_001461 [Haloferula luteola]|uniref:Uncharacterized protein n=1 Tax=Haloferula luteola TaxID=595692 RepID=A0A840UYK7_9BACT|nr:hypothetical protein [Haloferula luteola]MBB5351227.1 hypothetical protein [Haloferula luteola]
MRPPTLLALLVGAATGAGGLLQGLQWKKAADTGLQEENATRIRELESEIQLLRSENDSLRSLAQGGGEIEVPTALEHYVEDALGLEFRSSPVVHRVAFEELRGRVIASIESRFPPNSLDHRQQAWRLMGLLGPDDLFAPQLAATRSLGARSWFDDQTGDGWVTDQYEPTSIPDQGALLRVLVRILLHQHYPPAPGYSGDEPDRSREALHHGTALALENRFLARQALGIGFTGSQNRNNDAGDLLASLPAYIRGLATFPSRVGLPFAERHLNRDALAPVLHSPPLLTAQLYPQPGETPIALEFPELSGTLVLEESAGRLGLELWLETLNPGDAPWLEPAAAWKGDRYRLVARSDTQLDLDWEIELATPDAATRVAEAGRIMAGFLAQSDTDPAEGETAIAPDGSRISVETPTPTRVRFTHHSPE